ncbi:transcription factor bHLH112 isoform X2 [Populus trichocarpa]|uniref:BHLH domain-containing protein n=1 Tax=Populus trichocarpa TaxID=3694 RepID=U5GK46_POPTR|nr:transcription factor bHLH112 isoform X2 [Populus trichocarpa]|eukprot:XP_006383985.1 transcription factor bHLH112 isoform X2 [Populus trichocarpa]
MAEEFQAGICGENWWMNSSKSVFMGGLSPCSTVSITSDHMGTYGSWTTADMVDLKARSISCKESNHITTSVSDASIPFLNSQKPQQADSDSGGSSILIDSTLQMMGYGLSSSSSSSSDWNQALLPGNGRTESYNSMMQEEMNSGGLNSSQIQKDWSPKSYTSTAEDFSLDQQRLNPVNSSGNSPPTCQGFSTGFSMEPSASYGYPSTLIQSLFEPEYPQPQQAQSLFNNRFMNYLSPTAPNYGTNMTELSSPSWPKVSPLIKPLPKQQPSTLHFTNNTPYWNASPTGINDIRANLLPSSQSQFLVPAFEEKSNCSNLTTKPSKEVRDSVSVVKKGSEPAFKRPRIETPSPLPTFKVRKEKLGDRITALQQLVSPFGKTDTASVLHEAIEYIKFLHDQVLSTPYMKNGNPIHHQQAPADKLNDLEGPKQDLRSRGLCLVPVSSTFPVANETTADFWTPTFGGTFSVVSIQPRWKEMIRTSI